VFFNHVALLRWPLSQVLFISFHQQNIEFGTLSIASWLSTSNDALPHTALFRLLTIDSA
jgi:hypothetical protein